MTGTDFGSGGRGGWTILINWMVSENDLRISTFISCVLFLSFVVNRKTVERKGLFLLSDCNYDCNCDYIVANSWDPFTLSVWVWVCNCNCICDWMGTIDFYAEIHIQWWQTSNKTIASRKSNRSVWMDIKFETGSEPTFATATTIFMSQSLSRNET